MAGELNMFVTSVTSSGPHIKFYAQLHTEKYAALDAVINANQNQFDMSTLSSPYELKPGEQVLVKSLSGAAAKWHRARVNNIQSIEYGTVAIQFIDYGTNEVVHHSQICTSKNPVAASILAQPPLAVECVLADVVPALALWSDAAISFAESKLLFQMVRGQLVRQDGPEGPLHVRVYTSDGAALASQLVVIGLGRPAQTGAVPPGFQTGGYGAAAHPPPSATPPQQPEFAVRVKEMTTAPAQPGSELLVTVCHYSNGPAKFAIQNHQQGSTLTQLMADIQAYCRTSPPAPVPLLEPGAVCLGASASRDGQFLRGVLTQVDGGLVKVYWADFGHDETKAVGELRAMPRQFVGPWIQASRVSLAGLEGLTAAPAAAHVFRELTDGKLLTCKYRGKDQPNQVDLFDRDQSILELLLQRGAYSAAGPARGGAPTSVPVAAGAGALRYPSPAVSPAAAAAAAAAPSGPPLVPGSVTEVLVVEVGAVNNLYVRLAASASQLQQLLSQLSETLSVSGQQLPASNIRVGKLCAVLKDGSYQRAKVVSLGRRDIKVQYIDIGSSELVPLQSVLALEQRFAALPPQAFHCCLEGLESTHGSAEHVRFLQSVTAGGPLLCTVVQQTDRRVVRLTDPRRRPPLDINAAVRETVAAASQEPVQGQLIRGPPAVSVAKPPVEVGRAEQLVVMHVESPSSWFGQLAKLDADSLAAMEEAMQTRYSAGGNQPLSSAPIGTYCAAFSSVHEAVFRAKVIGRQGTQVTVFFIDYGDREETSVSNVFPLAAEFTQLPQLGISCYLQGAGAVSADAFRAAVLNQTVDVVLRACRPGTEVYEVALVSSSPTNRPIMEKLVPAGLREVPDSGTPPTSARPPGVGSVSGPPQLPQQQLPVGVYKEVEVVHVVTPAEFYVQLKEQFPAVDAIQEQVAAYAGQPPPAAPPAVGQTVAALYPDDGVWYRGRVLEAAAGKVTVFFVDYGDTRSVSLAEVRPLRPEHAALAGQAIRCCSSDVGRSGRTNWSEQEIESFRAAVMEVPYLARSDELRAGTAIVTLAKAELLEPVLGQPVASAAPPVTRQTSGDYTKKPTPRADLDHNWRDRPAGAGPTSPPAASSDPFSGRMRMDQPESYSRPQRSGGGGGGSARDSWGGGGGGDARGGRERSWEGHDDRGSQERSWGGHDNRGDRGAPDGASAFAADSRPSGGGGRPDRGGSNWPGSGRTRGGQDGSTGDDWSSGGGGGRPRGQDRNASGDSWSSGGGRPIRGGGGDVGGRPGGGRQPPAPSVSIPEHSCRLTPAALRAGAEMRAAPTWVCGLHEFYLQPLDGAEPFNTLMTEMQTFYGGLRRPQDGAETHPAVGKPVAARFTDGAWYRAVVRRTAPAGLDVFFVDYGNSATVDKQLVKRLKEEYCRLPCQAYKCQFGGVKPAGGKWKVLSEKELAKYFEGEVQVTCLGAEGDLSSVEVALTSSGQRATDQLVADGLAERPAAARPVQQSGIGPYPPLERPFCAGERVEVFVACVLSPSRLYVQLSENTAEIEQMATDIEASTTDCKAPCPDVAPEELCLAPFEGVYYRGLITAVDGQTASVFFVDYGNTERVNVSELVECPMSLVDLPAQAIQCSMTGLVSADCGEQLAAKVDQMELTALVDRVLPGSLIVTLLSGSTNINLELGGDGQARSPEPAAKKAATPTSAPTPAPAAAPVAPAPVAPAPVAPAPVAPAPAQAAPAVEEATETAAPFARVTVSFAVSPHEFYVQDAADGPAAQLDELMAQLETEYSQLGPQDRTVKQVQTGDLVAAPFADDGVFYRARLLTAEPGAADCQLHFIDYGNCQLTPRAQLKLLTPGLLAPAPLAQRCRLPERPAAGQWTDEDTELFEQLAGTLEKALALRREAGAAEDVWTVRLLDGDTDVGRELVRAGRALPPGQEPPAAVAEKVTTEAAPVQETAAQSPAQPAGPAGAARLKNGQLLEAAVVFAVSPTDFWVQLSADTATLDDLMARLEAAQLGAAAAPAAGQLLVARYAEDEALYRARVLSVTGDTATVLFVDYGNTESVSAAELWSCPPDLVGVPPLAVRCSLPLEPQPWSDAAVDKFSTLVGVGGAEERTLNMELVRAGDPALVNLFDGQQDVAFEMVGAGFGMVHVEERPVLVPAAQKAAEEPAPVPPAPEPAVPPAEAVKTDDTEAESEPVAQADEATESQAAPVPTTPAGDQAVFVSHVNSPLEFYVQSADTGPLDELMDRLAGEYPAAAPVSAAAPGLLAAAPYSEDGVPYRARVLAVEDGQARVLFVDYGNSESVDVTEVRQLGAELAALPPQARPCQLVVDPCEEGATEKLRELTEAEEEPVTVSEMAAGAVSRVRLTLSAGDAAQLLVEAGLCRPREDTQLPAAPPPPAEPLRLLVSHVDSPACFFVQRLSDLEALDELADQLVELYDATEPPPALPAPCCGDLCVARSAEEEGWHRARVEAVSPTGDVRVRLLDYGSVAAATEVRAAAPAVCRTPAMALRCRLPARPADGADWGQEATAALAELCDAAHYEFDARLVAEADGEPLVALLCLEGRSVTQTLQERGVAMVPESLAAESVQVKSAEGVTKEKKPVERETEAKPAEEASEKEKPAEEASEKEKPAEEASEKEKPAEEASEKEKSVEEAHEEEKPTDKEGTDDKVAKELDSLSLTERNEEGETKGSTEPSSQEPTETEQAEQNADETKQGLDESKSHETGKSSEATDSSEETQRDMEEDKTDQKSEVTAGASEEKTVDSDKEAVAEKPSSSDSAAPADAAETEESTSKVDEDTPGNGHVSPVNGDDVPEAAAQSVGQKASAVEEAPDAHEDAQAAA